MIKMTPLQAFRRSLAMVIRAAPVEIRNVAILCLLPGAGPAIVLWLNKVIIDEATRLLLQGRTEKAYAEGVGAAIALIVSQPILLLSIAGLVLLNLLIESTNTITDIVYTSLRDRVKGFVEGQVLHKVANFEDIALFETPELLNLVHLAEQGVQRLQQLTLLIVQMLHGIFIFIPSVLLSGALAWWMPLILIGCATPVIYVEMKFHKQSWTVEATQASVAREMNLYKTVLIGEAYAKELRLYRLQPLLLERWQGLFRTMFRAMERIRRRGITMLVAWSLLNGLGVALPFVYVVLGVLEGTYTLGDLALYGGVILQVQQSLALLIHNGTDVYDVALGTSPIFQLLELQPQLTQESRGGVTPPLLSRIPLNTTQTGIQIQNLSFTYPNSDRLILKDINLTIHPNEMIVLVGENGAGKTTLAKLLCRLYDPSLGAILWNEQDLRILSLEDLRSRIAVVMQDYARFPTTVRENVAFGCLTKLQDDSAIIEAIAKAGMTDVIEKLDQGMETLLGKQLEEGVDLSGGQWQRMALARALLRLSQAELLVLDEPTANLDPKTEHEIYSIFRTLATGRIAVVVSHRLALAKLADRVVVLEHGQILEQGTHEELMALGGQYHLMFTRQASSYN